MVELMDNHRFNKMNSNLAQNEWTIHFQLFKRQLPKHLNHRRFKAMNQEKTLLMNRKCF